MFVVFSMLLSCIVDDVFRNQWLGLPSKHSVSNNMDYSVSNNMEHSVSNNMEHNVSNNMKHTVSNNIETKGVI